MEGLLGVARRGVEGACSGSSDSLVEIQSSDVERRMLRFPKRETMCERQGRPCRIFVCAHGHVVDNSIVATDPRRRGGG